MGESKEGMKLKELLGLGDAQWVKHLWCKCEGLEFGPSVSTYIWRGVCWPEVSNGFYY